MRSNLLSYVIALTLGVGFCGSAWAQPKNRSKGSDTGDKAIEKQSEWENKVMGEDSGKKSEMKKIAEAKRLAAEAEKNPQPVAAPKRKDPNKEGVRAKQEAAIGLPIASDNEPTKTAKKNNAPKKAEASSSSNDALGALVASSLAEEKTADSSAKSRGNRTKGGGGKGKGGRAASSSSLDQMFAAGK